MLATRIRMVARGGSGAPSSGPGAWADWTYRRDVTIDNSGGASDLVHYVVRINLDATNWDFAHAETDGSDIRVAGANDHLIPYYIENYDNVGETATVWARVPFVGAGESTTLRLYSGNPDATAFQVPPTGEFTRPATQVMAGLAENLLYDSVTAKYYCLFIPTSAGPINLASASSPDGPWTNEGTILSLGSAGQWDDAVLHAPDLHYDEADEQWVLYYTGRSTFTGDDSTGYATAPSILGPYTRSPDNPVLEPSGGGWDAHARSEVYVAFSTILNTWICLFMGDSSAGTDYANQIEQVGYATGPTRYGPWTPYVGNPIIAFDGAPSLDAGTIADPFFYELNGTAYIGYSAGTLTNHNPPWEIGVVTTEDWATFHKWGMVYSRGVVGAWDGSNAHRGAWSLFGSRYYMPYTGLGAPFGFQWGVASAPALSTAKGFDPLAVFDYYDHFDGAALDANRWGVSPTFNAGVASVADSVLSIIVSSGTNAGRNLISRLRRFGQGYMVEVRARHPNANGAASSAAEVGFINEALSHNLRQYDYDTANFKKTVNSLTSDTATVLSTGWVTHRIWWKSATEVVYQIDDGDWETVTGAAGTQIPPFVLPVGLFAYRSTTEARLDVDYVIVRRYVGSDPVVTVGDGVAT